MAAALLARVLRAGRFSTELGERMRAEGVLMLAEGVWVRGTGSFRSPHRVQAAGVRMHFGAFAVTSTRVVALVSRHIVADAPFSMHDPAGSITLAVRPDGLHYDVDVDRALPGSSGEFHLHFRTDVPAAVLAGLPSPELVVTANAPGLTELLRWA